MRLSGTDWIIVLLLAICIIGIYAQTAGFEMVHYDDPEFVFENSHVRTGLNAANFRWAFTAFEQSNWLPLTWLSFMLDVQLFGLKAGPLHLVNVALHVLNTLLLYLLFRRMTGSAWRSGAVAALFALHPLHVESVAWITERKDVLSTAFGLGAMLAYVTYARNRSVFAYVAMLIAYGLSLLAKQMLVTLPFVLLLFDYWPLGRVGQVLWWRLVLEKVPLVALAGMSSIMTVMAQSGGGAMTQLKTLPLAARAGNAVTSYVHYMIDMFWPARLAVLYPFPRQQLLEVILGSAALLVLITAVVLRAAPRHRHLLVGWLWYLGTLVPVIGIVSVGEQSRADRYTYFPVIGLFIMIVWSIPATRTRTAAIATGAVAAAVVLALSLQTWRQIQFWRDGPTLLEHAISVVGPHPTLYINYGVALAERQRSDEAAHYFREALKLRPRDLAAMNNLADCLAREGKHDQALELYRKVIQINPNDAMGHYNLGTTLAQLRRYDEAEQPLREAVRLRPDFPVARDNLAYTLAKLGKTQ